MHVEEQDLARATTDGKLDLLSNRLTQSHEQIHTYIHTYVCTYGRDQKKFTFHNSNTHRFTQ